jgi:hypothetical protein
MTGERLNEMLAAHFRSERAIDAARRFLRRRREQLPEADIEYRATRAMNRWLSSRANRFRSRQDARGWALDDGDTP